MEMTKKRLEAYRSEKQEIMELRQKLLQGRKRNFNVVNYRSLYLLILSLTALFNISNVSMNFLEIISGLFLIISRL